MSYVTRQAAHCDQCSHEWLVVGAYHPTHCAKCKSRRWNKGLIVAIGEELDKLAPVERALGETDASLRDRALKYHRQTTPSPPSRHDPKTCRIYKCGMCAAAKL